MILIGITPEAPVADEGRKISALLRGGFSHVHLRHPGTSLREMRDIIESIPQELHRRLVLHGHFDLTHQFNLGGLHLNRRCPTPPPGFRGPLSRSCHTANEIMQADGMTYVTLSPIFDSISKPGYNSAFTPPVLSHILAEAPVPVVALGGISPSTLRSLASLPFAGYAMLGAIPWDAPVTTIEQFAVQTATSLNLR